MKKILFSLLGSVAAFLLPVLAMAQQQGAVGSSSDRGVIAMAAAFAVGIAALLDMNLEAIADGDDPAVERFDHRVQPAMRRRAADLPCQSVHAITI